MLRFLALLMACLLWSGLALARVDINTASLAELDGLKGIGPGRAQAIMDYRRKNGPFGSVDDLKNVPGIGPKIVDGLRGEVTVGNASVSAAKRTQPAIPASVPAEERRSVPPPHVGPVPAKPAQPASSAASRQATVSAPAAPPKPAALVNAAPAQPARPAAPSRSAEYSSGAPATGKTVAPSPARPAMPASPVQVAPSKPLPPSSGAPARPAAPAKPAAPARPAGN